MTDEEMKDALTDAVFPYLKPFLKKPDQAAFEVFVSSDSAIAILKLAQSDLTSVRGQQTLRSHFSRCYNQLCRHLDEGRTPSLDYEKA